MKFIAIIPARYDSTRFPGKPLAMLGDKTVIERVYRQAIQAVDDVYVATDDQRIMDAVEAFGGKAIMTSRNHRSGTDRIYEAYKAIGSPDAVIINIQGDEPFVSPDQIRALMACFDNSDTDLATLIRPFDPSRGYAALENPNSPKVIIDSDGYAMYFSRSVIPYLRGVDREQWPSMHQYYTHIGMYAYTARALAAVTAMPPSPLEIAESLEQLRWLQNGLIIMTAESTHPTIGIDTPADLEAARQYLATLS